MNSIFVTGAQGFLGRAFVARALASGSRVIGFGRSERSDDRYTHRIFINGNSVPALVPAELLQPLNSAKYEYHRGDLLETDELAKLLRSKRPRAIVHLAAALRDDDFGRLVRTNVAGTMALFDAVTASGIDVEKIVIGSSASVYGKPEVVPIRETARCEPEDLYGVSKLAAERIAAIQSRKLGTQISSARIFNVVGAGQDERHVCGRLASQAIAFAGGRVRALQFGDLRPTRDFIDVRDAAAAIAALLRGGSGTYNVCSQMETSIGTVLDHVLRSAGIQDRPAAEQSYRRDGDVERNAGNNERLRSLGWKPRYDLARSIDDLVEYYRGMSQPSAVGINNCSVSPSTSAP